MLEEQNEQPLLEPQAFPGDLEAEDSIPPVEAEDSIPPAEAEDSIPPVEGEQQASVEASTFSSQEIEKLQHLTVKEIQAWSDGKGCDPQEALNAVLQTEEPSAEAGLQSDGSDAPVAEVAEVDQYTEILTSLDTLEGNSAHAYQAIQETVEVKQGEIKGFGGLKKITEMVFAGHDGQLQRYRDEAFRLDEAVIDEGRRIRENIDKARGGDPDHQEIDFDAHLADIEKKITAIKKIGESATGLAI
jgi:hypothetical protein